MVVENQSDYASLWAAISAIALKIGCTAETLRIWVRQEKVDIGLFKRVASEERKRIKVLEREVRELCQANKILQKASACFAPLGNATHCLRVNEVELDRPFKQ